jgi:hypothetical protein
MYPYICHAVISCVITWHTLAGVMYKSIACVAFEASCTCLLSKNWFNLDRHVKRIVVVLAMQHIDGSMAIMIVGTHKLACTLIRSCHMNIAVANVHSMDSNHNCGHCHGCHDCCYVEEVVNNMLWHRILVMGHGLKCNGWLEDKSARNVCMLCR